jgi:hypothetical protein
MVNRIHQHEFIRDPKENAVYDFLCSRPLGRLQPARAHHASTSEAQLRTAYYEEEGLYAY